MDSNNFALFVISELGVSGLGGMCFGRPPQEMSMKLSVVDFVGQDSLDNSEELMKIQDIGSPEMVEFLRKHCGNVTTGIDILQDYFSSL